MFNKLFRFFQDLWGIFNHLKFSMKNYIVTVAIS